MVCPVTDYHARSRSVYFPRDTFWFDFWTGKAHADPTDTVTRADAPLDRIPLFVRPGSIIPMGPDLEFAMQKKSDPLTIFVYGGKDADFSLYEDDGLTNAYEKNEFSRIPLHWSESTQTVTLSKRTGQFPGMLQSRTINVILIGPNKPVPYSPESRPDKTVAYVGERVEIKF
jgi:alpha-D-xyloside xylohydrolase